MPEKERGGGGGKGRGVERIAGRHERRTSTRTKVDMSHLSTLL